MGESERGWAEAKKVKLEWVLKYIESNGINIVYIRQTKELELIPKVFSPKED